MLNISSSNTILYCTKWQECVHFYQHVLNFPVNFAKDDWFREFRVNEKSCISVADVKRCTIASSEGVGVTMSWSLDELESLHAHLKTHNVRISDITSHSWRAPYFYAWDPEGNRIEFWQNFDPKARKAANKAV